jgi:tRNA(Arg) A34 adenosine deaminase TadA
MDRRAPNHEQILRHLRHANAVAQAALAEGHHPFGAVLVGPDNETVLAEQGNIDSVNHAESVLARRAAERFDPDTLWHCTLYTTFEPCAMCIGTQYWAHIGRVVYGASERDLLALTGDHAENPTLDLPCREVIARGQKAIEVIGPVDELRDELLAPHRSFWSRQRSGPGSG